MKEMIHRPLDENPCKKGGLLILGWLILMFLTYYTMWVGVGQVSITNLMYDMTPWVSTGSQSFGEYASDVIDSETTNLYSIYYGDGYTAWNGDIGFGTPIGYEMLMNPFNWFYLLPLGVAFFLHSAMRFSLAYFGFAYLLAQYRLDIRAILFGAASYGWSSAIVMWHFWPHSEVLALAPFAVAFATRLIKERKVRDTIYFALTIYLLLIAEMPTFAAYVIYFLGFYVLTQTIRWNVSGDEGKLAFKKICLTYIEFGVGIILGAICSLPYLISLSHNVGDYVSGREQYAYTGYSWDNLRSFLFSYYDKVDGTYSADVNEQVVYIGMAALMILLLSFIRIRKKANNGALFFLLSGLLLLGVGYARAYFVGDLYSLLPAISTSMKTRIISLSPLPLVVLASLNLDDILRHPEEYRRRWDRFLYYAIGAFLLYRFAIGFDWTSISRRSMLYNTEILFGVSSFLAGILAIIAVELTIQAGSMKERKLIPVLSQTAIYGLLLLTLVNMAVNAKDRIPMIASDAEALPEATDTISYLQSGTKEGERVYIIGSWTLFPNTNTFYGIPSITSHSFMNTKSDVNNFLMGIDPLIYATSTNTRGAGVLSYNLLRYAGVRFITMDRMEDALIYDATLVYEGEDSMVTYQLDSYNPRVYLAETVVNCEDPEAELSLMKESYAPSLAISSEIYGKEFIDEPLSDEEGIIEKSGSDDDILLTVRTEGTRELVLNEYHDENWICLVDGEEVVLDRVNYLFLGVTLEAGEHTVEFIYQNPAEPYLIPAVILLIILVLAVILLTILPHILEKNRKIVDSSI